MLALNCISKKLGIVYKRTIPIYFQKQFFNNINSEFPQVAVNSMKKEIASQQLMYEDGNACLTIKCVMCEMIGTQNKNFKIYVNKTTGFCSCQCNKYSGSWEIFEKFLKCRNNEKSAKEILNDANFKNEGFDNKNILSTTKLMSKIPNEICDSILDKFNFGVTYKQILLLLNTRIDESHENLYIPLLDLDNKVSGYRILRVHSDAERTIPTYNTFGLISARASRSGGFSAVVVPSIKDFLVLLDAKVPGYVVCLPYGFTNLPQTVLPNFEKFTKITLWFGNDVNAWDTARNFAKKLGEKRCFFVRPTEKQPLPHIAVQENQDLKAIITSAQPIWHKAITTFASLRADVLAELQNIDKVQGVKWKRFPTLNKILKGHRRGELTVITGPTGCGKTTFISEYSLDLAMQNVNTLWGSFEIRNARLARTMLQQMAGCELDENLHQFDDWADRFEQLPIYFMTFHGQQSIKIVMEAVEHATYMHDISHVIIDNVQFMMGMSEEPRHQDRFWKQDAIVASFRTFATKKNCHVTLVMHPRKERDTEDLTTSSIFGGAKASQEADNVLIIQDKRLTTIRGKKYLQIVKNRYTGDLGIMPMNFDKSSLSYAQKPKKTDDKENKEKSMENG